jgi:hypothetical protein
MDTICPRPCLHPECSARRRAALEQAVTIEPTPKVERKVDAVSDDANRNRTPVTHAERQRRWRKKNPGKHADQQRAARVRRKKAATSAGKEKK